MKNVLVTGAGGSIGSELCRQILELSPKKIVLLENSEYNLYSVHQELLRSKKRAEIIPKLATVTNSQHVNQVISSYNIDTIYHAAAYKHVPLQELNPWEAVQTNIQGTINLVDACELYNVERFVLVSTDKAVNPTNVMGASKRISEMFCR